MWFAGAGIGHCCTLIGASQVVLVVKNLPASAGDIRDGDSAPGSGRSPGDGDGNPLQYSCLGDAMDRGALWAMGHGSQRVRRYWSDLAHTYAHCYGHSAFWCSGHLDPLCAPVPRSSSLPSPVLPPSLLPLLCLTGQFHCRAPVLLTCGASLTVDK